MPNNKYNEKYSPDLLAEAAANSISIAGVLRYLQIPMSGGTRAHWLDNRIENPSISVSELSFTDARVRG
jgi:hypothetical protein